MLDYQRIVDNLRSALYQANSDGVDLIRSAVADYSVACDEVNERLRQCWGLLSRGLRSEAIQLCEIEPNLLELAATLDMPDRIDWIPILARYGIMAPTALLMDTAAELNEAYSIEQPLAALLRLHRLMALGHSPLPLRLRTLRNLASLDPNNPVWREDLLAFERERFKQIQQEAQEAKSRDDLPKLKSLHEELGREPWSEIPPEGLVRGVAEAFKGSQCRFARRQLHALEPELNAAFAAMDVETGSRARQSWTELLPMAQLAPDDVLLGKVAPALEWLTQEDQRARQWQTHQEAAGTLEWALDKDHSLANLERLYEAATQGGFGLTVPLETRYRERIQGLRRTSVRRRCVVIAGIVMVIALAGGSAGWMVFQRARAAQVAAAAEAIQSQLHDNDLKAAQESLDRLAKESPGVAAASQMVELRAAVTAAVKKANEADRVFDAAASVAAQGLDALATLASPAPDQTVDADLDEAMANTRAHATTTLHKTRLVELQGKVSQVRAERQRFRDEAFREEMARLTDTIASLEKPVSGGIESWSKAIAEAKQDWTVLESRLRVSFALKEQAKPIRSRLSDIEDALQAEVLAQRRCRDVTGAVGDARRADPERATAFRKELQRLKADLADSPKAKELGGVLEETPLWETALRWQSLAEEWRALDLAELRSEPAGAFADRLAAALKQDGAVPGAETAEQILAHLEAIRQRQDPSLLAGLNKLFRDPLVSEVWMVENTDGARYYLTGAPSNLKENSPFKYVLGFDMREQGALRAKSVRYMGRSPQAILAERVNHVLSGMREETWEASFFTILEAIQATAPDVSAGAVDPVLKIHMLHETLKTACQGSHSLATGFAQHLVLLEKSRVNPFANWFDPKDGDGQKTRVTAANELRMLPDFVAARKTAETESDRLRQLRLPRWRWVGWLNRSMEGRWACAAPDGNLQDAKGRLFVICPSGATEQMKTLDVGRVERGQITLAEEASSDRMRLGRPVFMTEDTPAGESR